MFPNSYFARRYFADRYFPPGVQVVPSGGGFIGQQMFIPQPIIMDEEELIVWYVLEEM